MCRVLGKGVAGAIWQPGLHSPLVQLFLDLKLATWARRCVSQSGSSHGSGATDRSAFYRGSSRARRVSHNTARSVRLVLAVLPICPQQCQRVHVAQRSWAHGELPGWVHRLLLAWLFTSWASLEPANLAGPCRGKYRSVVSLPIQPLSQRRTTHPLACQAAQHRHGCLLASH